MNRCRSISLTLSLIAIVGTVNTSLTFANNEVVHEAQKQLTDKEYNFGSIDGVLGKTTKKSIKKF